VRPGAFQPSDAEFTGQLPAKIEQLDIDSADLEQVEGEDSALGSRANSYCSGLV